MIKRSRREYLRLLDASKIAAESAIDIFNSVWHPYRNQATLMLLANSWELLSKAVLVHEKESILRAKGGDTISAQEAVFKLQNRKILDKNQAETIQQIISLRHAATHYLLPDVPAEVMQHLLFYSLKFFRATIKKKFPKQLKDMSDNYLTLSFSDLTTYADKVQKSVSKLKKSPDDKKLIWLLERGIAFDGSSYLSETQFDKKYLDKKKVLSYLALNKFVKNADMVRVVPVQAPHNYTADITLRKGSVRDASLPILVKKTEIEEDYPYLTKELASKIGKNANWVGRAAPILGMKNNEKYHQAVRSSATGSIQRYSEAALQLLKKKLTEEPTFNPYKKN